MIVYGDPQYTETMASLLSSLMKRCQTLLSPRSPEDISLDELRRFLIESGQVEAAVQDGLPGILPEEESLRWARTIEAVTDAAAAAFYRRWAEEHDALTPPPPLLFLGDGERRSPFDLDGQLFLTQAPDVTLNVKRPEGFAFYALYPEQYCMAALRWAADHAPCEGDAVVVVGIRSIGTSLSAAVEAALKAAGWPVYRLTVRPSGHPFEREVSLSKEDVRGAGWGLVVDEGPGLSGSSMAAVGAALERAGLPRQRISVLPWHGGEPGTAASPAVRRWWAETSRYVIPPHALRWGGRSLPDALADAAHTLCGLRLPVRTEDLGGGLWRGFVYRNPADWPAASIPFERPKYRCTGEDGTPVLWKYAGLDRAPGGGSETDRAMKRAAALAAEDWTVQTLGQAFGFVAAPWIEGAPLTLADRTPQLLRHMGRYIVRASGLPLSISEGDSALSRLQEMLYWNTWEALGEEAAAATVHWRKWIDGGNLEPSPRYGDGRMAPHEWLRTPSGAVLKMDCLGHDNDHTAIGPQGLVWDTAGAWIEWELDDGTVEPLLEGMQEAGAPVTNAQTLLFYRMAYAAFRAGQCSLCAGMCAHNRDEAARLWAAYSRYRDALSRLLTEGAGARVRT